MSILTREVPNEARIEMTRISGDRDSQREVAQLLVKSTSAICAAIGAQPIPLADLPILTTLQLVMVSGIMYLSGRERSLRAATEFVGAIGANVGVGMLFREGARALLKFSRLGQRYLRNGRGRRHLCDRPGRDCLFSGRRFSERGASNLSRLSEGTISTQFAAAGAGQIGTQA